MKSWLAGLWVLCFFPALGYSESARPPAWVEKIPVPQAGSFPLPTPGKLQYSAGWAGKSAGKINITFANDGNRQTMHATGGTIGIARTLFPLDSHFTAECDPTTLAPRTTLIKEIYRSETRHTTQQFDREKVTRQRSSSPAEKDDGKIKVVPLPHVLDLQSSLLYIRSQPLQVGDEITFLTYATGSPYIAKITVLPKEEITIAAGKFSALKLHLDLKGIDKKFALKPYRKARNITAWMSDDSERKFLKFTGELLVGAVFVELEK